MLVVTLKFALMYKLYYRLEVKLVSGMIDVLVNISKVE